MSSFFSRVIQELVLDEGGLELVLDEGGEGGEDVEPLGHPRSHLLTRLSRKNHQDSSCAKTNIFLFFSFGFGWI